MAISKILRSSGAASTLTILLLLSAYIFTLLYNSDPYSGYSRAFLIVTIVMLSLFLISFVILALSLFNIKEIRATFSDPVKLSILTSALLGCAYISTVLSNYATKAYGQFHSTVTALFYLSLIFLIFFVISFLALLVSFSNNFIFSRT